MVDPTGQVCEVPTVAFDAIARLVNSMDRLRDRRVRLIGMICSAFLSRSSDSMPLHHVEYGSWLQPPPRGFAMLSQEWVQQGVISTLVSDVG
jgi:hypothetical protein